MGQAQTIILEDFEDSTVGYTTSIADDLSDIANRDYFGRIASDTASPPADVTYTGLGGTGYYGIQDTDGANSGNIDQLTLDIFGLNINNYENLQLSFLIAEDDATDGNEDWDTPTSVRFSYQIDGGGFVDVFAVESELGTDGNETNERPLIDTDFNGVGDGAEITNVAMPVIQNLAGTGSVLDIRVSFDFFDTGDEDIAIDNISVMGEFTGVPEPGTAILLAGFIPVAVLRRRRAKS